MKTKSIVNALLKIIPAVILLQTLFFKFSAAPESVYIFEQLNLEPWGRIGLGIIELIVAVLILIPKTTCLGALLGIGIMLGALFSHLTKLGVVVQDDGGTLFILALVTLLFCLVLAWQRRYNIPFIKNLF
ncbi:DoxX family protein [Muricauda sp. HICW]|uniref:DoxX family protein n=1 Tax=Flagellimonas chongwuensis TaxID=2697365 RepID=A0A850NB04_9FLAO|nr:DoxX family protein [Allomuricauda chongwuensis]NVN18391.1 DoxX family protein [Allomuricauda chongwuensis]